MDVDFSKKEMACGQSCKKERQKDVIAMLINQDRGYKGIGMEGRIATWYAKNTQKEIVEFGCLRIVFPRKFLRTAVFLKSLPPRLSINRTCKARSVWRYRAGD